MKELSTTWHDPYRWHNYTWHIRGLNLGQVPEGGCSSPGSELQECLGASTGPEASDVPAPIRCAVVENVRRQAKEQWKGVSRLHSVRNKKKSKNLKPAGVLKEGQEQSVHIRLGNEYSHNGEGWELMASGTRREIPVPRADVQLPNRFSALEEDTWLEALYTTKHQIGTWWQQQVIVVGRLAPAGDRGLHLSFCLREVCLFWVALIRDVMEGLPRCISHTDYLTLQRFPLSTNGYSTGMPGAYQA